MLVSKFFLLASCCFVVIHGSSYYRTTPKYRYDYDRSTPKSSYDSRYRYIFSSTPSTPSYTPSPGFSEFDEENSEFNKQTDKDLAFALENMALVLQQFGRDFQTVLKNQETMKSDLKKLMMSNALVDHGHFEKGLNNSENERSVLIEGVPEEAAGYPEFQEHLDRQTVGNILNKLGSKTRPVAIYRIGKHSLFYPCPIKVVFSNVREQIEFLVRYEVIKPSPIQDGVKIVPIS